MNGVVIHIKNIVILTTIPTAKVIGRRQPPVAARRVPVPALQRRPSPRHELVLSKD